MNPFEQIAEKIILEQELIIGPVAWGEASKVAAMTISPTHSISIEAGKQQECINELVLRYEKLFGRASREVCREAASHVIAEMPLNEVPLSLRAA
jgi:hypothetical protein